MKDFIPTAFTLIVFSISRDSSYIWRQTEDEAGKLENVLHCRRPRSRQFTYVMYRVLWTI